MQDQSCHVPSAACQMPKSTGCCLGEVYCPRSGSPAICQKSPSTLGTTTRSWPNMIRVNPHATKRNKNALIESLFTISPFGMETDKRVEVPGEKGATGSPQQIRLLSPL